MKTGKLSQFCAAIVFVLVAVFMLFGAMVVSAQEVKKVPYFQLIDLAHPQTSIGGFSAKDGQFAAGGVLALITHTAADKNKTSLMDGWVPLDIGGTLGSGLGGPSIAIGSGLNLLPAGKAIGLLLLDAVTKGDQFTNLKDALKPPNTGSVDLVPFIGPHYNIVFVTLTHVRLVPTWFIGGTLKFGGN
jgi:hypothetical protein